MPFQRMIVLVALGLGLVGSPAHAQYVLRITGTLNPAPESIAPGISKVSPLKRFTDPRVRKSRAATIRKRNSLKRPSAAKAEGKGNKFYSTYRPQFYMK